MEYIKLRHEVIEAKWSDVDSSWRVQVRTGNGEIIYDQCDVLLSATGVLK